MKNANTYKHQFQCNQSIFLAFKGCNKKKNKIYPNIVYIQCVIEINTLAASSVYCSLISQIKSLSRKMIFFLLCLLFLLTRVFPFLFFFFFRSFCFPSLFLGKCSIFIIIISELNLFDETKS